MLLDETLRQQCLQYFELLENPVILTLSLGSDEASINLENFAKEIKSLSTKISIRYEDLERTPSLRLDRVDQTTGIVFAALPLGHEFASFILALLQVSGRKPKIEDKLEKQILSISKTYHFETYISLSCHICPDVVQAFNILAILNPKISHTMIDGGIFKEEIITKDIMAVPSVFLEDELFHSGRISLEELIERLLPHSFVEENYDDIFDILVIGGGPAGASAAIYGARKGLRVGLVAKTMGGQVLETVGIENVIGTPYTEGSKLAQNLEEHVLKYPITMIKNRNVTRLKKDKNIFILQLENQVTLQAKSVIVATGARWRNINVPGEEMFKNKGVAYCPHCDGPLFANKDVAVIGGGNSGIEAAIDLANIAKHVHVIEFLPDLKADQVLQDKLKTLKNVSVTTNAATQEILGDHHVNALVFQDRTSSKVQTIQIDGVFVQIGLVPNTEWLEDSVAKSRMGEIITDKKGATSIPGLFAAGDCSDSAYKQIIISMGSGATAALSAFDYLIRMD